VLLLAHTDTLHGTLSGLATKKLMERAYGIFGDARYQRLATISVAHLYNLRQRPSYQHQRQVWTKTRPATVPIGERRAPTPNNRPGYLRVDSVHQGDLDGIKGVYHINAVDCVTQYEGVATCEKISEAFLLPVLEALLLSFPFVIHGFHSDNGSEYINKRVAKLLNKLLIEEQTKSRSRHSNDNAQAESKNGAIVRKHLGYSHIPQCFAALVNAFCRDHLNPYINFHRPCLFAETITDAKGRQRKRYPYELMMTPYEKLKSLPLAKQYLKHDISFKQLDTQAKEISDNEAAQRLNDARAVLFKTIFNRSKAAA
jgi:transposase InsO family protein